MPIAAVVLGYGLRLIPLPVPCFAVFVSSAGFPAWVESPQRSVQRPLRARARVSSLRLPSFPRRGDRHGRSDFGPPRCGNHLLGPLARPRRELTAEPAGSGWSLIAGVVVYTLTTVCMATIYFVLLRTASGRQAATVQQRGRTGAPSQGDETQECRFPARSIVPPTLRMSTAAHPSSRRAW